MCLSISCIDGPPICPPVHTLATHKHMNSYDTCWQSQLMKLSVFGGTQTGCGSTLPFTHESHDIAWFQLSCWDNGCLNDGFYNLFTPTPTALPTHTHTPAAMFWHVRPNHHRSDFFQWVFFFSLLNSYFNPDYLFKRCFNECFYIINRQNCLLYVDCERGNSRWWVLASLGSLFRFHGLCL